MYFSVAGGNYPDKFSFTLQMMLSGSKFTPFSVDDIIERNGQASDGFETNSCIIHILSRADHPVIILMEIKGLGLNISSYRNWFCKQTYQAFFHLGIRWLNSRSALVSREQHSLNVLTHINMVGPAISAETCYKLFLTNFNEISNKVTSEFRSRSWKLKTIGMVNEPQPGWLNIYW